MARMLVVLALLIGALGAAMVGDGPRPRADLVYVDRSPVFTLDPPAIAYEQDIRLGNALYDGLVRTDPYTFEVVPGVAERWDLSEDGRTYTFHLRTNARWSNGDAVVAGDFVYSWLRALTPDLAGGNTRFFFLIRGAEDFFRFRSEQLAGYAARPSHERTPAAARALFEDTARRFGATVGVRAVDDRTLVVDLDRPAPYFLDLVAFVPMFPVHPPTLEAVTTIDADSGRIDQGHEWTKPGRHVGNGPYTLVEWRFKRDMRLERNPMYWNAAEVRSASIEVRVVEDPATRMLVYETGAADWVTDVEPDYLPELLARNAELPSPQVHGYSRFGTYFWSFNCAPTLADGSHNPLHDPRVRLALCLALNRNDLVEKVRRVGERATGSLVPPGAIRGFDDEGAIRGLPFDPALAAATLAEAGWRDRNGDGLPENGAGESFPIVEMLCSTGSYHERIALAMGDMWRRELGIRSRVVSRETKTYRDDLGNGNFMVARGGWFADYADPTAFLSIHVSTDHNNYRAFSNPRFDDLFARAESVADPEERMRLLEEAERLTTEIDPPVIPLWVYRQFYLFDARRVHGVSAHPRMMQRLDRIWVDPGGSPSAGAAP